jgi:hypothetical protein
MGIRCGMQTIGSLVRPAVLIVTLRPSSSRSWIRNLRAVVTLSSSSGTTRRSTVTASRSLKISATRGKIQPGGRKFAARTSTAKPSSSCLRSPHSRVIIQVRHHMKCLASVLGLRIKSRRYHLRRHDQSRSVGVDSKQKAHYIVRPRDSATRNSDIHVPLFR